MKVKKYNEIIGDIGLPKIILYTEFRQLEEDMNVNLVLLNDTKNKSKIKSLKKNIYKIEKRIHEIRMRILDIWDKEKQDG